MGTALALSASNGGVKDVSTAGNPYGYSTRTICHGSYALLTPDQPRRPDGSPLTETTLAETGKA